MKTHFKSALNQVHANQALITKTEEYLRNASVNEPQSPVTQLMRWRNMNMSMKKWAIAACTALLLVGGGAKAYATPISYMSLDINPSVELGVNALGKVVTAEGYNADGKSVLNGIKVTGNNVSQAVSAIVNSAAQKGFIAKDGSTTVSLTAETDNDKTAAKLKSEAEEGAKEALAKNGQSADVRNDVVALARRDEARKLGITPGKLNLIQKLLAVDSTATIDEYKDAPVKDIMKAIQSTKKTNTEPATKDNENANANNNNQGAANNNGKGNGALNGNGSKDNTDQGAEVQKDHGNQRKNVNKETGNSQAKTSQNGVGRK